MDIGATRQQLLAPRIGLKAAETWLAATPEHADPAPTPLQREYVLASRNAAARRQRMLMIGSVAVAAVSVGLLIFRADLTRPGGLREG